MATDAPKALQALSKSLGDFSTRLRAMPIAGEDDADVKRHRSYNLHLKFQSLVGRATACFEQLRPFKPTVKGSGKTKSVRVPALTLHRDTWAAIQCVEDVLRGIMFDAYGVRFHVASNSKTGADSVIVWVRDDAKDRHQHWLTGGIDGTQQHPELPSIDRSWIDRLGVACAELAATPDAAGFGKQGAESAAAVRMATPESIGNKPSPTGPAKRTYTSQWTQLYAVHDELKGTDHNTTDAAILKEYARRFKASKTKNGKWCEPDLATLRNYRNQKRRKQTARA